MFEKNKNVTEANFYLQFDTVMVQNSFHPIYEISFYKLLSFYTLMHVICVRHTNST